MNSKEKDCVFVVEWLRICDGVVENQRPAQALFHIWRCLNMERSYKRQGWKMATWDSAWILTLERKWNIQGWTPKNASKLITFVEGRLNFSCKSSTAANVDLMESLLDNWLKNNHITLDKIYYLCSCLYFLTNFSFQIYFSTAENQRKNRILWQLAKIRQSKPIKWEHRLSVGICDWQAGHLSFVYI